MISESRDIDRIHLECLHIADGPKNCLTKRLEPDQWLLLACPGRPEPMPYTQGLSSASHHVVPAKRAEKRSHSMLATHLLDRNDVSSQRQRRARFSRMN